MRESCQMLFNNFELKNLSPLQKVFLLVIPGLQAVSQ